MSELREALTIDVVDRLHNAGPLPAMAQETATAPARGRAAAQREPRLARRLAELKETVAQERRAGRCNPGRRLIVGARRNVRPPGMARQLPPVAHRTPSPPSPRSVCSWRSSTRRWSTSRSPDRARLPRHADRVASVDRRRVQHRVRRACSSPAAGWLTSLAGGGCSSSAWRCSRRRRGVRDRTVGRGTRSRCVRVGRALDARPGVAGARARRVR